MKKIQDERITSQVHRYGYEAFMLMSALVLGAFFIKAYVFDRNGLSEFILLMVGLGYFLIRCFAGGAVAMPSKQSERITLSKRILMTISGASLLFGAVISIRNCFLYQGGQYNWLSFSILVISAGSLFILGITGFIVFIGLSSRASKKNIDE